MIRKGADDSMRTTILLASLAVLPGLFFCGCGDDFQAGSRFTITSLTDLNDHSVAIFNALEKTDDSGINGILGDNDEGEGDGYPDANEERLVPLGNDLAKIILKNETRLGVDEGVDLYVYRIDVTYYDNNGASRIFAPRQSFDITGVVPADSTGEFTFELIPVDMKILGLRDEFLSYDPDRIQSVRHWLSVVDVYARDIRNSDTVHAQASISVTFINPMIEEVTDVATPAATP